MMDGSGRSPRPHGGGFCLEGPGFYVWDEDEAEVRRVVDELGKGNRAPRPTRRMLVIVPPDPQR